ncbi:hypothetical protein N658DRAFT_525035 [Parathielavia hyrcaniae]|uniref:Nitronate monooxygenase domain-containing protein n=1 Tax=Parathielavia hyrcaniae TaxID=113614 RepID=A0AAN6PY02_9PEZI|nr:hypothetical protein N658DRAFT_525035 [Parathielavia hyrcaniae]
MAQPLKTRLATLFPHVQHPVIFSAPMLGTANSSLAAEVSKAGGLGILPGGFDFTPSSPQLTTLDTELSAIRTKLNLNLNPNPNHPNLTKQEEKQTLPIGTGFILSHPSFRTHFLTTALPILLTHRPAAIWLFAPRPEDISSGAVRLAVAALKREGFVVMFQVGTVAAARQAVLDGADVLVCQGVDAGGHQFAAGGAGVFTVAEEAWTPEFRKKLILGTTDGGPATVKTPVLDDIQGTPIWPDIYDGRALAGKSWQDHAAGMPLEENIRLFQEADKAGDQSRKITWVGTGVGLVKRIQPAGDIVREVREDAIRRIQSLQFAF